MDYRILGLSIALIFLSSFAVAHSGHDSHSNSSNNSSIAEEEPDQFQNMVSSSMRIDMLFTVGFLGLTGILTFLAAKKYWVATA